MIFGNLSHLAHLLKFGLNLLTPSEHQMNSNTLTQQLFDQIPAFNQKITALLTHLNLDKFNLKCDHIALRINDLVTAKKLAQQLSTQGQTLSNKMINGRPIIIFKLNQGVNIIEQWVHCIELPYPSDKHYKNEGWEHIELVLDCQAKTIASLTQALLLCQPNLQSVIDGNTDIKVKMSTPQGINEHISNPTIAFKYDDVCIKIHPYSIEEIIKLESPETDY